MPNAPRTLRSPRLRAQLWWSQGGRCARCGGDLGDDWQVHHVEPWAQTHRTNIHELQALCLACHKEEHHGRFGSA
jgi:predicted HNH restriction endonuclease